MPLSESSNGTSPARKQMRRNSSVLRQKEERLNRTAFFRAQREEAEMFAIERDGLLDQAQIAFDCNDKYAAKELSDKAKIQHEKYEEANRIAAEVIFKTNNTHVKPNEIDFHGLDLEEVLVYLRKRIEKDLAEEKPSLTIIIGQGENNDAEGEREVMMGIKEVLKKELKLSHVFDFSDDSNKLCRVMYKERIRQSVTPSMLSFEEETLPPASASSPPTSCCTVS